MSARTRCSASAACLQASCTLGGSAPSPLAPAPTSHAATAKGAAAASDAAVDEGIDADAKDDVVAVRAVLPSAGVHARVLVPASTSTPSDPTRKSLH